MALQDGTVGDEADYLPPRQELPGGKHRERRVYSGRRKMKTAPLLAGPFW